MPITLEERRAKKRAYNAAYHQKHREEHNARDRAWHAAHREHANRMSNEYYNEHQEELRQDKREYRAMYPERVRQSHAVWRKANHELIRVLNKAYGVANPDKVREWNTAAAARRRAQRAQAAINAFTNTQWREMKQHYGHRCVYCGKKQQRLSQDHIIPLSKGGNHTYSNIVPACKSCNSRKHAGPVLCPIQPLLLIAP